MELGLLLPFWWPLNDCMQEWWEHARVMGTQRKLQGWRDYKVTGVISSVQQRSLFENSKLVCYFRVIKIVLKYHIYRFSDIQKKILLEKLITRLFIIKILLAAALIQSTSLKPHYSILIYSQFQWDCTYITPLPLCSCFLCMWSFCSASSVWLHFVLFYPANHMVCSCNPLRFYLDVIYSSSKLF